MDGGLRTIGLPDAIAGATLWAARLSGKLNGLIAGDRADREAPGDPDPVLATRACRSSGIDLAGHPLRLLGAEAEGQDRPVDLDERVADRLAGLERDEPAELLAARLDPGADVAQDRGRARRRAALRVTSNAATAASTASSYCASVAL